MRRFLAALAVLAAVAPVGADVLAGTWNLRWFPSGRAEHRASPQQEAATIQAAADLVRTELAHRRRRGDHVVLFFQELRNKDVTTNLVAAIGDTSLALASVSAFRDYDWRLGWQQNGIVTDMPVLDAGFSYWRRSRKILPPRGFAYALLDGGKDGLIACYCVHLKSNYGAVRPEARASNRAKREMAMEQFVVNTKKVLAPGGRPVRRILLAGDFNTDPFSGQFEGERTLSILADAAFADGFDGVPPEARGTHPGNQRFPASTLDFIFHRGFSRPSAGCDLSPAVPLSDHRMVWLRLK